MPSRDCNKDVISASPGRGPFDTSQRLLSSIGCPTSKRRFRPCMAIVIPHGVLWQWLSEGQTEHEAALAKHMSAVVARASSHVAPRPQPGNRRLQDVASTFHDSTLTFQPLKTTQGYQGTLWVLDIKFAQPRSGGKKNSFTTRSFPATRLLFSPRREQLPSRPKEIQERALLRAPGPKNCQGIRHKLPPLTLCICSHNKHEQTFTCQTKDLGSNNSVTSISIKMTSKEGHKGEHWRTNLWTGGSQTEP